jgi:hypothetical protein
MELDHDNTVNNSRPSREKIIPIQRNRRRGTALEELRGRGPSPMFLLDTRDGPSYASCSRDVVVENQTAIKKLIMVAIETERL